MLDARRPLKNGRRVTRSPFQVRERLRMFCKYYGLMGHTVIYLLFLVNEYDIGVRN
jgi:hypothetical protein